MAINQTDVKLLKSQRLTDEDDGGGRATGTAVVDGQVNNLFPDISRLDRTTGRINLRKAFAGVLTDNADAYLGAHAIIAEEPEDPRVSVLLFSTGSQTDERSAAKTSIENYVVPSVRAQWELLGNQLKGQRALVAVQREENRVPEIGQVYQLVNGATNQFVRLTSVEASMENFFYEYASGQYLTLPRRRLTLGISAPLGTNFPGGSVSVAGTSDKNLDGQTKTIVLSTQVADAARYYGISPLAAAVAQGDLTLRVQSVYSQLVPSATKEIPLIDQLAGYQRRQLVPSGPPRSVGVTFAQVVAGQYRTFLGTAVYPGSLTISLAGGTYVDNRKGDLVFVSGSNTFTSATVDYLTGEINAFRATAYTASTNATYTPAAPMTGPAITGEIEVNLSTRGYAYTLNLAAAKPRPGTLTISYMALGDWYEITDPGNGELVGQGGGSVDFTTGSVSFTLSALPDVDSSIIYNYLSSDASIFTQRTGSASAKAKVRYTLPHQGLKPGTISIAYTSGGVSKTVVDNGSGNLTGQATGFVNYTTGKVEMTLSASPDAGTSITYQYEQGAVHTINLARTPDASGVVSGTLPGAPFKPGSVVLTWSTTQKVAVGNLGAMATYDSTKVIDKEALDNGLGGWIAVDGTIDYATGAFSIQACDIYQYEEIVFRREPDGNFGKTKIVQYTTSVDRLEGFGGTVVATYQETAEVYGPQQVTQTTPALTFDLLPGVADPVFPGSLILSWGGKTYVDREGVLYTDLSSTTNAGSAVGTVDYAAGECTLTAYAAAQASSIGVQACLTHNSGYCVSNVVFRTPGAPLRPGSLQITAVRADTGEVVTSTADLNGNFNGPVIYGAVDASTGIARLYFSEDPLDSSSASDVPVAPQLLRYNAVLYSSLPLNADLIGLDPVRLPADGRVPIYREGEVLVIHHTGETLVSSPQAGGTVQLDRDHQAAIEVFDADGVALAAAQYSVDRELGTVSWANPLLLQDALGNPLSLPLTIRDRVEHMAMCTEVQITGMLGISAPLPWDLPAGQAKVSSAVAWGDLQARLYKWFTQKTWNSGVPNWTDAPIGDATTSNYNSLNYPQVVTNKGAIAGKWAIVFTSATAFQVVEEKLGVITTGTTSSDCAPINPATGAPYFTILAAGWGSGWAAGNAVRFNTDSCLGPVWIARTVLSGQGTVDNDQVRIQIRGDSD